MEYDVFIPYAEQYYMSHSCPTREAWAAALKSLARARPRAGHCLRVVLARYAAWIAYSSRCERTFAKTQRLRGGQSEDGFFVHEEEVVQLQADPLPPSVQETFFHKACQVWAKNFGRPRATGMRRPRIDRGVKRKRVLRHA